MEEFFDLHGYLKNLPSYKQDRRITSKRYHKGEYIYRPPSNVNFVFQITKGVVKIGGYSSKGFEVVYDVLTRGDTFGNLRFLDREFNEFSKALTDVELSCFETSFFRERIVKDHTVSEWFKHNVVQRWCKAESRLFSIASNNVNTRIKDLFKELYPHYADQNINFDLLLTKQDIADLVGATRQTVAVAIKKIKAENEDFFKQNPHTVY